MSKETTLDIAALQELFDKHKIEFCAFTVNPRGYDQIRNFPVVKDDSPLPPAITPLSGIDVHVVYNQKEEILQWNDEKAMREYIETAQTEQ